MSALPDYYAILEVSPTATFEQVRTAYKKAALRWHPDRVPTDSPERSSRTKKFQRINDAYYTLSDKTRRSDYDEARRWHSGGPSSSSSGGGDPWADEAEFDEEVPRPQAGAGGAGGGFSWSNLFGGMGGAGAEQGQKSADEQFSSAFEEMLNEQGLRDGQERPEKRRFWSVVGGIGGGMLGFIVGNWVGATAGAAGGAKLGNIRDQHGKSVYEVFQELPQQDRMRLLTELASRVFANAIS